MEKSNDRRGQIIFFIMLAVAVLIWLSSCITPQKATSYLKEKGMLDDTCAANFPVQERIVPVVKLIPVADSATIDSLKKDAEKLKNEIARLDSMPPVIDSADCQTMKTEYHKMLMYYAGRVKSLEKKLSTPIVDTSYNRIQRDSAEIAAANGKIKILEEKNAKLEAENTKLKDQVKDRGKTSLYSIIGNGLLLLLIGFILAKKRKA